MSQTIPDQSPGPQFKIEQNEPLPIRKAGAVDADKTFRWALWVPIVAGSEARACVACNGPFKNADEAKADLSQFIDAVIEAASEMERVK